MAELRHSSSIGSRATPSPLKRDEDSSPFLPDNPTDHHDRHSLRDRDRDRPFWSNFHSICPFFSDEPRVSPHYYKISILWILLVIIVGFVSISAILNGLVSALRLFFHLIQLVVQSRFSLYICNAISLFSIVVLYKYDCTFSGFFFTVEMCTIVSPTSIGKNIRDNWIFCYSISYRI